MEWLQAFHFLRPWWLLALLPAAVLLWLLRRYRGGAVSWRQAIAPELLEHLLETGGGTRHRWPWWALLAGWTLCVLALAGPAWERLPQPVEKRQDALVILLDLSLSMYAEDVPPSRLTRARHKILDLLAARDEGQTALVAYSGDAHVVSPLTDDTDTIANLVPALSPDMMPAYGSNPRAAVQQALTLFANTNRQRGRILLLSDSITARDAETIASLVQGTGFALSILTIGTEEGAPIPLEGGYLKDRSGEIVVARLSTAHFEQLAAATGARLSPITLDDSDLQQLLPALPPGWATSEVAGERRLDRWLERGPWLVIACLPLALLAFRRGWLLAILPLALWMPGDRAHALEWSDLWQRPDQQAVEALHDGEPERAAELFDDPRWRGAAEYRAGDYDAAAEAFAEAEGAHAHYNRGNALARAGKLQQALGAYDQALALDPTMTDAQANRELVEQLLEQQQQQQQQQQGQNQQQGQGQQQRQQPGQQGAQQPDGEPGDQQGQQQPQGAGEPAAQDPAEDPRQAARQPDAQAPEQARPDAEPAEQPPQAGAEADKDPGASGQPAQAETAMTEEQQRQEQATEQWLRQIPDDPAGLLRNKFNYEYRLRQQRGEEQEEEQPLW